MEALKDESIGPLNDKQKEILNLSSGAIEEMKKTVESLLEAANIEEGKYGYTFKLANLEPIVDSVLSLYAPKTKEKNIKLIFYRPQPPLPPFIMDPDKIKLVIQNLVDNAIKYNVQNGEVKIKIEKLSDKPFIKVSVEDTGMGIPQKDLDKIFSKFYRSEPSIKQETRGIGLGLYICKNIVQNHGGEI